jgi:cytochrome c2
LTVVYPDVAVNQSCVSCHNARQEKQKYKTGDVLGGLVVRIALEL